MRIIDATNARLGRLSTTVAKAALEGETIAVINCEQAIISGKRQTIEQRWRQKMNLGQPSKGPFYPRQADRFVRRTIRGMLPYKQPRGKDAFGRVMCYLGVPTELQGKPVENLEHADLATLRGTRYVTVNDLCRFLGGRTQ